MRAIDTVAEPAAAGEAEFAEVRWSSHDVLRALWHSPRAVIGGVAVIGIVVFALVVPFFAPSPTYQNLTARLVPPIWDGGSTAHILGTDALGRDVMSRLASGVGTSLLIVVVTVACSLVLGTIIGLIAGFYGGVFDAVVMRLADVQLAFPQILLILFVVSTFGASVKTLIVTLSISSWVLYARVVRSQTIALKNQEFVDAARAIGSSGLRSIRRHILPNVSGQLIVIASFAAANVVLIEAALSFLGLGVPPPEASLGGMISDGQQYMTTNPWLCVIPGIAIFVIVIGVNLIGDWLREVYDPRGRLRMGRR